MVVVVDDSSSFSVTAEGFSRPFNEVPAELLLLPENMPQSPDDLSIIIVIFLVDYVGLRSWERTHLIAEFGRREAHIITMVPQRFRRSRQRMMEYIAFLQA